MLRKAAIDLACPIDPDHPDNAGLVFALLNLPGFTGGGRWPDASQRTNGGTLVNGPLWSADGLTFSGGQVVTIPDSDATRPAHMVFVIDLVFAVVSSGFQTLAVKPRRAATWTSPFLSWMLRQQGPSMLEYSYSITSYISNLFSFSPVVGTRYRIGVMHSPTRRAVYVNGVRLAQFTGTFAGLAYDAQPVLLGASHGAAPYGEYFNGTIREARLVSIAADVTDAWFARDYERSLRPLHEDPTLRKLRNWAFWDLGAAGPGTVSADANIVQAVGSLLASAAVLIGAAADLEQSQTAAGAAGITVGADATTTQSQQAEAGASITVGAAASLEQPQSLAASANIIVGAGVEASQGGTLTATMTAGESTDTGAGFPWLVAGLGYW